MNNADEVGTMTHTHHTTVISLVNPIHWLRKVVGLSIGLATYTVSGVGAAAGRVTPGTDKPMSAPSELEAAVGAILEGMDVPHKEDIERLSRKIDELNAAIAALSNAQSGASSSGSASAAADAAASGAQTGR